MADQGMKCDLAGLLANAADQIDMLTAHIREDGHPEDDDPAEWQPNYYAASLREAAKYVAGLEADQQMLNARVEALIADRDRFAAFVLSLSARVHAQAELLGKAAGRGDLAARVADLERAVAPFAEILVTGWDDGSLPADALYPVKLGDLRQLARVMAGTSPRAA